MLSSPPSLESRPDDYHRQISARIPTHLLRHLSVRRPWVACAYIFKEWAFIFTTIWICSQYWNLFSYIVAVIFIASRQHALAVLMHEGSHYLLAKNKNVNNWISDLFLAWPTLITTESYRSNHLKHHRFTNTEKDPDCLRKLHRMDPQDWEFPTSPRHFLWMIFKDLIGLGFLQLMTSGLLRLVKGETRGGTRRSPLQAQLRLLYYAVIIGVAIGFHCWKSLLLLWVVPYVTAFMLLLRIRSIAEHFATENDHPLNITRTTLPYWWERICFPDNINYHIEHHLFPSVPFHALPRLHRELMKVPEFREKAHITHSYWNVLLECIHPRGPRRSCLPL